MPVRSKKNLIYTVIFDAPESESYRFLGKMLVSSLLRTFFTGDILVYRNSPAPLYLVERKGLEEIYIDTPKLHGQKRADYAWAWKYKAAELIENPEQYDKILFLDADCLALRNIDHLLCGDWDIRYQPEKGQSMADAQFNAFMTKDEMNRARQYDGANSGTVAVRGSQFHQIMARWGVIDESINASVRFRDQASWNALLLRHSLPANLSIHAEHEECWKAEQFPAGEIAFPGYLDPSYSQYTKACLTHNIFPTTKEKTDFTFGLFMRTFFADPSGIFLSMIEM